MRSSHSSIPHSLTSLKQPDGATDGADKYPGMFMATMRLLVAHQSSVYSVSPSNPLLFTIEKLLASKVSSHLLPSVCIYLSLPANAHRLFVTTDSGTSSPILSPGPAGNLSGIVSAVDSMYTTLIS